MQQLLGKIQIMAEMTLTADEALQWFRDNPHLAYLTQPNREYLAKDFYGLYQPYHAGETGLINWNDRQGLRPEDVVAYDQLPPVSDPRKNFNRLAVIKLNGGLGTSMGLSAPKSLLEVRDEETFMDLMVEQARINGYQLLLMNSYSTDNQTQEYLKKYQLNGVVSFLQNIFPRMNARTKLPVNFRTERYHEDHCNPPGHGDIYRALVFSGLLEQLLTQGIEYLFISNSDNLGAIPDARILNYMVESDVQFLAEGTQKTKSDTKGGTFIRYMTKMPSGIITSRIMLLEQAQTPKENIKDFEDIQVFKYFNTNNIWVHLPSLKEAMAKGNLQKMLPLIVNAKKGKDIFGDASAPDVIQLEQAMGGAISAFEKSVIVDVPRTRFAPVKENRDLLMNRYSNVYEIVDGVLRIKPEWQGRLPVVKLDPDFYKKFGDFDIRVKQLKRIEFGKNVKSLTINGDFSLEGVLKFDPTEPSDMVLTNTSGEQALLKQETISTSRRYLDRKDFVIEL